MRLLGRVKALSVLIVAILYLLLLAVWPGIIAMISRRLGRRVLTWWSRGLLKLMGVRWKSYGELCSPVMLAPNHYSWVDIILLLAIAPVTFLSKYEVRGWPIIGWVGERAGFVFIGGAYGGADEATHALAQRLSEGDDVAIFPEGWLNQTAGIQPFYSRLFRVAQEANRPVQPVAIRYRPRAGQESLGFGDLIPERDFRRSAWWLAAHGVEVEAHFLPVIEPEGRTRTELANQARQQVADKLELPLVRRPRGEGPT